MDRRRYVCPGCGGEFHYDPTPKQLVCEYCGTVRDVPRSTDQVVELDVEEFLAKAAEAEETSENRTTRCRSCGAATTLPDSISATRCPFCGSASFDKAARRSDSRPRSILPFSVTRDSAVSLFKKWVGGLWFAPNRLKREGRTPINLHGVYLPFWTFDGDATSLYAGESGERIEIGGEDTDGESTTRTEMRWTPVEGWIHSNFDDILVAATESVPGHLVGEASEWNLSGLVDYTDDYVSGFRAEIASIELRDGLKSARERMEAEIRGQVVRDIGGDEQKIHSIQTQYNQLTFKPILLPIWISSYRYGEKAYRFIVNGVSGRVRGERPYSWWKIAAAVAAVAAVIAILVKIL